MGIRTQLLLAAALLILFSTANADPSDEQCLTNLHESLYDPFNKLLNWSKPTFKNPCQGFTSILQGVTCNNGRIYKLSLTNLSLKGTISPYVSNCTNLQSLDLSSNSITGPIPTELQYMVNLAILNLSYNRLFGQIPSQLTSCAYLNVIDLHKNELTGSIPQEFGLLVRLSVFDVSDNKLSGAIPGLVGNRFNASSYEGNKNLYGYPLVKKSRGVSIWGIVGIGLGSGLLSLFISFSAVCIWLRISEHRLDSDQGSSKVTQSMPNY